MSFSSCCACTCSSPHVGHYWVLLQHKERWGRLLAPEGDSEWQPIPLRMRLPAISEWYQADWKCATARGSKRSSAYSTARKSVPCFWFLPWASLGMISTRLIIMSYQYTTWSTLRAFQQVNNTCRISLQKGNIVHYTRYTINDNTVI